MAEEIQSLPDTPDIQIKNGKVTEVNAPKPVYVNDGPVPGNPTIVSGARSVVANTAVNASNENLAHVCDFVSEMTKNIEFKKFANSLAKEIRKAIRAIMRTLGFGDPTGEISWLRNTLQSFKREVDYINEQILKPIIDFERYVIAYTIKLREIVQWILGLPEKFLIMLQDCLQRVLKQIANIFKDIGAGLSEGFADPSSSSSFSDTIKDAKAFAESAKKTVELTITAAAGAVSVAGSATIGLFSPTNAAELKAAEAEIAAYESTGPVILKQKNQTP